MKKAIVLGAAGGTGAAITMELVKRGIQTVAFGRSRSKLEAIAAELGNPAHLSIAIGDAFRNEDLIKAAHDSDVMFHCANVPYHEMKNKLLPLGEAVMKAAHQQKMKIVIVDGIYPYGRSQQEKVTEEHPKQPHTEKGKVRLAYEQMIFSSRFNQAQPLIARLPDYYGPTANQASYLGSTLADIALGKTTFFLGNMKVPREFIYLPDAANMIVELAAKERNYGQNWHIVGPGTISGQQIVNIARKASGISKPVIPLGKVGLSLLGMFVPVMKEVVEMLYLTEEPLILSSMKYESQVGPVKATSFERGITETILALKQKKSSNHPT